MEPLLVHLQIPFTRECLLAMVTHMGLLFSLRIWRIVIKVIGVEHQSLACPLPLLGQLTFPLPSWTLASFVLEPNADGFTRNLFKHIIEMGIKKIYITQRACLEKPLDYGILYCLASVFTNDAFPKRRPIFFWQFIYTQQLTISIWLSSSLSARLG